MDHQGTVIVITQPGDDTTGPVSDELEQLGVSLVTFDTSAFPMECSLTARHGPGEWEILIDLGDRALDLGEVRSIWVRRPTPFLFPEGMTAHEREFADREAQLGIGGLLRSFGGAWVNHPEASTRADFKPLQLSAAANCGFDTPRTLITNDPAACESFFDSCPSGIIYKTFGGGYLQSSDGTPWCLYTSEVSSEDLLQAEHVRHTTCLFQEAVESKGDIRVTVIGDEVFAVEICCESVPPKLRDWRADPDAAYFVHELPDSVAGMAKALLASFGLSFGALDLALMPDGRYVFFELNPGGEWLWLEQETALPMAAAMAKLLVGPPLAGR